MIIRKIVLVFGLFGLAVGQWERNYNKKVSDIYIDDDEEGSGYRQHSFGTDNREGSGDRNVNTGWGWDDEDSHSPPVYAPPEHKTPFDDFSDREGSGDEDLFGTDQIYTKPKEEKKPWEEKKYPWDTEKTNPWENNQSNNNYNGGFVIEPERTPDIHIEQKNEIEENTEVFHTDDRERQPEYNDRDNTIYTYESKEHRSTSFFSQPGILAAIIGGAVVGLFCAILLVMFIVYRMRKADEGSYPLAEKHPSNHYMKNSREFYA